MHENGRAPPRKQRSKFYFIANRFNGAPFNLCWNSSSHTVFIAMGTALSTQYAQQVLHDCSVRLACFVWSRGFR